MKAFHFLLAFGLLFTLGCNNEVELPEFCRDRAEDFDVYIEEFLDENYPGSTVEEDGVLKYVILEPGAPELPTPGAVVTVDYEGMLTNGNTFDANTDADLSLQRVIQGWTIGIPKIGAGGKILLFIPPSLGYGNQFTGRICPGSDLVFEVDLISWVN